MLIITALIPKLLLLLLLLLFTIYKNERKEHKFWRQKKTKQLYKNKKIFRIDYIDVNKVLVSEKETYGTKNSFK